MERVFNREKALKHAMNDRTLLVDLLRFTLEDVPDMLARLEDLIGKQADRVAVADQAHKIKGSAGAVSAERLFAAAFDLEETAKEGGRDRFDELYVLLRDAFNEFREDEDVRAFL